MTRLDLEELIDAKARAEHSLTTEMPHGPAPDELARDVARLFTDLDAAAGATDLPDQPTAVPALHDLIVRLRLGHG